jgi:hypothetical protein
MKSATSRGPRPTRAHLPAREGKGSVVGTVGDDSSDYHQRAAPGGTARIPMPDARPACRRKRPQRTAERATCRCPSRTTHGRSLLHARNGHLSPPHDVQTARPAARPRTPRATERLVGLGRLERPTSRLSGVRSNQLSYRPKHGNDRSRTPLHQRSAPARPEGCWRRDVQTAAGIDDPRRSIKIALAAPLVPRACPRRRGPREVVQPRSRPESRRRRLHGVLLHGVP